MITGFHEQMNRSSYWWHALPWISFPWMFNIKYFISSVNTANISFNRSWKDVLCFLIVQDGLFPVIDLVYADFIYLHIWTASLFLQQQQKEIYIFLHKWLKLLICIHIFGLANFQSKTYKTGHTLAHIMLGQVHVQAK